MKYKVASEQGDKVKLFDNRHYDLINNYLSMTKSNHRISQEHTSEIFALAAELQAKHEQTYSLAELREIGAEAHISPEFIDRAVRQIQLKKRRAALRATIVDNVINLGAIAVIFGLFTGFAGLPNHCSSAAQTQPENSELLPNS
ncbi:hypothetical protein [Myxosarcina sp. GI1]|uniref:hypothetical protein n=1 Tax=Myxosarcina sp. GI1 TaxID=1541065 RepID=UPI0006909136|nr:hypothetical protein [Myxosarcina sp. GI1]